MQNTPKNTSASELQLVGFGGKVYDYGNTIDLRVPIVCLPTGDFAYATSCVWHYDVLGGPSKDLRIMQKEFDWREQCTEISPNVLIISGQCVGCMGPAYFAWLRELCRKTHKKITETIDVRSLSNPVGFVYWLTTSSAYRALTYEAEQVATFVFDGEFRKHGGRAISSNAQMALEVLENTPVRDWKTVKLRTLLALQTRGEVDVFDRVLNFYSQRYQLTAVVLKELADALRVNLTK